MTCRRRRCAVAVRHAAAAASNFALVKRLAGQAVKAASADPKRNCDARSKMAVARAGTFHRIEQLIRQLIWSFELWIWILIWACFSSGERTDCWRCKMHVLQTCTVKVLSVSKRSFFVGGKSRSLVIKRVNEGLNHVRTCQLPPKLRVEHWFPAPLMVNLFARLSHSLQIHFHYPCVSRLAFTLRLSVVCRSKIHLYNRNHAVRRCDLITDNVEEWASKGAAAAAIPGKGRLHI